MDAAAYQNDSTIEIAWALKAIEHAEIHYSLITSIDPTRLCLSQHDDKIYELFREFFPEFNVTHLNEEDLKNDDAKKVWRKFCNKLDDVENFNYGALLRLDPMLDYNESNTTFVTRIQFLAVEIARNREGVTTQLYNTVLSERIQKSGNKNVDSTIEEVTECIETTDINT